MQAVQSEVAREELAWIAGRPERRRKALEEIQEAKAWHAEWDRRQALPRAEPEPAEEGVWPARGKRWDLDKLIAITDYNLEQPESDPIVLDFLDECKREGFGPESKSVQRHLPKLLYLVRQRRDRRLFDLCAGALKRQWLRSRVSWPIDEAGYTCDWHRLRVKLQHLHQFVRPVRNLNMVYPAGSFERVEKEWLERELRWTREWRLAEIKVEGYCGGREIDSVAFS
jgi:hypothetical protein